uniref:Uncharacterized protein n=1 Tax=Meloidogyne javanica TaxID=6303 RepID=A0A915MSN6_MELJA
MIKIDEILKALKYQNAGYSTGLWLDFFSVDWKKEDPFAKYH